MRVCILAHETLLHWASHYLTAFRKVADVISIGPSTGPENHDFPDWSQVERYVVRNDIVTDECDVARQLALLPEGWIPDLVVVIQSGAPPLFGLTELACPTAYLSVDTWHDPRDFLIGYQYDFVFLAQKGLVKYMRQSGCRHAFWLPLACEPEVHYAAEVPEEFDIGFIGSAHFGVNRQRVARLDMLDRHFKLGMAYGLGSHEMAEAYGRARLIFNASIAGDVNMRVFEALATGKPLVTNREAEANGLLELFEDGKHLITYTDENLVAQVRRCLDHPEWARAIGEVGRREVLEKHTYVHRAQEVLDTVAEYLPGFGARPGPTWKTGRRVSEFVPVGARRLLDFGMGLDASRIALRARGVRYLAAVAPDADSLERRAKSYDDTVAFSRERTWPPGEFDAILWSYPQNLGLDWAYVFEQSRAWLAEGGRAIIVLDGRHVHALVPEPSFPALENWFLPWGFKLLVWRQGETESDYQVLVACQLTADLPEITARLYQEFPINGVDTDPAALLSGSTPDSPDVEHP